MVGSLLRCLARQQALGENRKAVGSAHGLRVFFGGDLEVRSGRNLTIQMPPSASRPRRPCPSSCNSARQRAWAHRSAERDGAGRRRVRSAPGARHHRSRRARVGARAEPGVWHSARNSQSVYLLDLRCHAAGTQPTHGDSPPSAGATLAEKRRRGQANFPKKSRRMSGRAGRSIVSTGACWDRPSSHRRRCLRRGAWRSRSRTA